MLFTKDQFLQEPLTAHLNIYMDNALDKIKTVVDRLIKDGVVQHGQNYCFATSELIQYMLAEQGIDSHLVEVELTYLRRQPPGIKIVGGEQGPSNAESFPSHMVTVTDTEPAYLIDISIGQVMILPALRDEFNVISTSDDGNIKMIYKEKIPGRYPEITHRNILDRIQRDRENQRSMGWMKKLIMILLTLTAINFTVRLWDFYQVWLVDGNYWGPETLQQLDEKIDRINRQLEPEHLRQRMEDAGIVPKKSDK